MLIIGSASIMCTPGRKIALSRSSRRFSSSRRITRPKWIRNAPRSGNSSIHPIPHRLSSPERQPAAHYNSSERCGHSFAVAEIVHFMLLFFPAQSRWSRCRHWSIAAVLLIAISVASPATFGQTNAKATEPMTTADATTLREALADYDQQRSQEAQTLLQDLLTRHPSNFDVNETLGLIHAEAGDFSAALLLLERAAHQRPGAAIARANLGTAYLKLHQPGKAIPELEAAARLQPGDQQTEINLAHAWMEANQSAKAAHAFAAAAALGPLDADTTHDRALALLQSGDAAGAKRVLDAIPQGGRDDALEG